MDTPASLVLGVVAGVIGPAYALYGWRARHITATAAGAGLMVLPMATESPVWLGLGCAVCLLAPFVIREV